jgi:glycosyltransferase involved in cell wall biosynthesis
MNPTLTIAIDINITPGAAGGVAQSTAGLVSSLGQLDGPETYLLIVRSQDHAEWIRQYAGPNQRVILKPKYVCRAAGKRLIKRALRPGVMALRRFWARLVPPPWPRMQISTGFYESLGCDVLHFPTQAFELAALPTIYNPHDLQHLHWPQFFEAWELAEREVVYRTACQFAQTVVVGSQWIKQDVIAQYGVRPEKVQVIPWASPTAQYPRISTEDLDAARRHYGVPATYALYPAVAWPHKNHLRLFEALALLRDRRGLVVNLVCTGARHESSWAAVQRRMRELRLDEQVKFLGFLPEADLRAVYRLAQFLVLPSLFEADSCPIHEAWSEGIPVASSNIAPLREQVGDAGIVFDPTDVTAMADAIERIATDGALRCDLVAKGHRRARDFDWKRTATAYRAVYRRAAGRQLNREDRWLLQWDWMRDPHLAPPHTTGGEDLRPPAREPAYQAT